MSRALIDFQMEMNDTKQEWADTKWVWLKHAGSARVQVQVCASLCIRLQKPGHSLMHGIACISRVT